MKSNVLFSVVGVALVACVRAATAAPLAVFDGSLENGFVTTADTAVDSTMQHDGHSTVKVTPSSIYFEQVGFYATGGTTVPGDATTLQLSVYVPTTNLDGGTSTSANPIAGFIFQSAIAPTYPAATFYDSNSSQWTVDGQPGTALFTRGAWHTVTLDLQAAFTAADLSQGTTPIAGIYVQANGDDPQSAIYLDDVKFVSAPEPATLGVLAVPGLLCLKRKRMKI